MTHAKGSAAMRDGLGHETSGASPASDTANDGPLDPDLALHAVTNDSLAEEAVGSFQHRVPLSENPFATPSHLGDSGANVRKPAVEAPAEAAAASEVAVVVTPTTPSIPDPPDALTKWQTIRANKNVFRVLCFCFLDGGAFSIWNMHIFQVLIKDLGTNIDVGWMSAFSGVSQMIAAVLVGFIGERFLRETLLRCGAVAGFIAVLITLIGVYQLKLSLFYTSQIFWGCYSGIVATATEAIFADSVATGRRAFIYNVKWMDQTMSSVIGTFLALILLVSMGNTWEQPAVIKTMYGGLLLHPIAMSVLFSMRDKYSLKEEDDDDADITAAVTAAGMNDVSKAGVTMTGGNNTGGAAAEKKGVMYVHGHEDGTPQSTSSSSGGVDGGDGEESEAATAARYEAVMKTQRSRQWNASMRSSNSRQCLNSAVSDGDCRDAEEEEEEEGVAARIPSPQYEDRRAADAEEPTEDMTGSGGAASATKAKKRKTDTKANKGVKPTASFASPSSSSSTSSLDEAADHKTAAGPPTQAKKMVRFNITDDSATRTDKRAASMPPTSDSMCAASASTSATTIFADHSDHASAALPTGCGEKALVRYLNHQAAREHEAFHSEQAALSGQPIQKLLHRIRYYMHLSFTWEAVPFYVCLVDFLVAFGSGMTMRFLPLYFIDNKGTSPVTLMTANLLICPVQALLSHFTQVLGTRYTGRIASTIAIRLMGTFLMLIMGLTDLPLVLLIPIYILRNSSMNATRGVTRSVIMDAVKKENRAKWSAFESFSSFTWAGSATIGGYIAEARGYQFSFTVTALFHFLALAVLVPAAVGSLPVEKEMMREAKARAAAKRARKSALHAEEVTVVSS